MNAITTENNSLAGFSFSAISTFQNCPRSFKFRYIEKLPEAFTTIEAYMGTCVHETLEWAYTQRQQGYESNIDMVMEQFRGSWNKEIASPLKVVKEDKCKEDYYLQGKQFLVYYFQKIFPHDRSETLFLEHTFQVVLEIGERQVHYRGIIDRIARLPDGTLRIIDYKTGKVGHPLDTLQLPSYAMYIFQHNIDPRVELCYEDLKEQRTDTVLVTRKDIRHVKEQLVNEIKTILNTPEDNFAARPSTLCLWCGYNTVCPSVYAPSSQIEPAPGETRSNIPGVCPQCQGRLQQRNGRFGSFLGCSNYPECRYTFDLSGQGRPAPTPHPTDSESADPVTTLVCPQCNAPLRQRNGKFGPFYGCSNFPECRYTKPID